MRHFQASAVERRITVDTEDKVFTSHPMEAGWASEAICFLIVEEIDGVNSVLDAMVQISADGINWIDEGTLIPGITQAGHYFAKVSHFGNWLRVEGRLGGKGTTVKISVHLHLKS